MLPVCVLCNNSQFTAIGTLPHGVTSDSRLWPHAGQILVCKECGHVQKKIDAQWHTDVLSIYNKYRVHAVSSVHDHALFDSSGQLQSKSAFVIQQLLKQVQLPASGDLLDVGCGIGGFLRQFHAVLPAWSLYGMDIAKHFREQILGISGVQDFYTEYSSIKSCFDLITLNDVFEHLPDPSGVLLALKPLLKPEGKVLIRCPNFLVNPFDLTLVDHCSHYTPQTLATFLQKNGFQVQFVLKDVFKKEISVVASMQGEKNFNKNDEIGIDVFENEKQSRAAFRWLTDLYSLLHQNISVYGSSVAATWSAGICKEKLLFFVDDDVHRQGEMHLGHKIIPLNQAPVGKPIFLAFPPVQAQGIRDRLRIQYPEHVFMTHRALA